MKKNKHEKLIAPLLVIAVCGFIMWRVIVIAPQFYPYFLKVAILGGTIFLVTRVYFLITAIRCPKCRGAMQKAGFETLFSGAENTNGGKPFDPLEVDIRKCEKCGNEHYKLSGPVHHTLGGRGDIQYRIDVTRTDLLKSMGLFAFESVNVAPQFVNMTQAEYDELVCKIKDRIRQHNLRAGFPE